MSRNLNTLLQKQGLIEQEPEGLGRPLLKLHTSPTYRFERKSVVEGSSFQEVLFQIKKHPLLFSEIYNLRKVNSIYFDTPDFRFYEENVSGSPSRRKIRIRWYGDTKSLITSPVLEVKGKKGALGFKNQYSLESFKLDDKNLISNLKTVVKNSSSSDEVKEYFKYLRPISLVSYYRKYYISKNQKYRLTVDTDVNYLSQRHFTKSNNFSSKDPNIIIEVKYAEKDESPKLALFKNTPWRVMKNSKYVNSVDSIRLYA